jgi:hypothetical protein
MAYNPGRNPFNPLIVGAIAVMLALAAFLLFRDGTSTQQAGIESPPPISSPGAVKPPPGEPNPPPTTPNPPANQPAPKGTGNL